MADDFQFEGFDSPNFTMTPNQLFDQLLPHLNEGELKCLLYIIRRTFGFQRDSDSISIKQMMEGLVTRDGRRLDSGVGLSRSAVIRALQGLQKKGCILSRRNEDSERGSLPSTYALRLTSSPQNPQISTAGGSFSDTPPVSLSDRGERRL